MIFSRTSRYAIRALAFMAEKESGAVFEISALAKKAGAPAAYLAKVFQGLSRAGLLVSHRGQGGGHLLSRDPKTISLLQIVEATDDVKNSALSNCVMGLEECSDKNPCTLHDIWVEAAKRMKDELMGTTLEDVAGFMGKLRSKKKSNRVLSRRIRAVFE